MPRMPHLVRQGKRSKKSTTLGEADVVNREDYEAMELDSRLELIRSLIPLGLIAVYEELDQEAVSLAGARVPIDVPPVRGRKGELRLQSYDELHRRGELNEVLFRRVL